ncbi:MAG: hypothetical protein QM757_43315 [Paludibaculum sp.]
MPNWIVKSLGPLNGRLAGSAGGGANEPLSICSTGRGFALKDDPKNFANSPSSWLDAGGAGWNGA